VNRPSQPQYACGNAPVRGYFISKSIGLAVQEWQITEVQGVERHTWPFLQRDLQKLSFFLWTRRTEVTPLLAYYLLAPVNRPAACSFVRQRMLYVSVADKDSLSRGRTISGWTTIDLPCRSALHRFLDSTS